MIADALIVALIVGWSSAVYAFGVRMGRYRERDDQTFADIMRRRYGS